ncbi:Phospholipase/carboxylesterase [Xylaria arbuscula]|uniref:Phospholipase/carboxylesterase/thioesterase domain-containing protein n=1 Tax=Xylaria arbuscula TaxID=114810 RepID=A0A9W8N704_9PEZI|nr:Phospholipase/carboxylesterase [Xylaria arbuscula]KAJ3560455.1 hypothetical protein NPX13_g9294 [Xylaria arbuscula]
MVSTVSLPALNGNEHTHTFIFLHGQSSNAHEISQQLWDTLDSRGVSIQHIFPSVKWLFPQAGEIFNTRYQMNMREWSNLWDSRNPDEYQELQIPSLRNVIPELVELIEREAMVVGLENIILGGISHGCATAIQVLLNLRGRSRRLCAFVGIAGWMSFRRSSAQGARELLGLGAGPTDDLYRNTPAFIAHSADDNVTSIEQGKRLRDTLAAYGMTVTWKEYPTGGHWINTPQGIEDVVAFLKAQGLVAHQP